MSAYRPRNAKKLSVAMSLSRGAENATGTSSSAWAIFFKICKMSETLVCMEMQQFGSGSSTNVYCMIRFNYYSFPYLSMMFELYPDIHVVQTINRKNESSIALPLIWCDMWPTLGMSMYKKKISVHGKYPHYFQFIHLFGELWVMDMFPQHDYEYR